MNTTKSVTTDEQVYYDKYRSYFEYSGFHNNYVYRIQVKNYNGNTTWPLHKCPKCGYDLKKDPPISRGISIEPQPKTNKTENIFASIGLLIIPVILLFLKLYSAAFIAAFCIIFLILLMFLFNNIRKNPGSLFFYYCPNCHELIYNKIPFPLRTIQTPGLVFKELEKIPGFKLK